MQREIEERDELCKNARTRISQIKTRMFFDRLKLMTLLDKLGKER